MKKSSPQNSTRDGFGMGMLELGKNPKIIALCADLTESLRLGAFKNKYPQQFIEVGISEQNMAGIGAGFAIREKIPFICSFAAFNPGRNWEQIRVSVCYSNLNVKVVGGHGGITVGPDGATHQALEDIALVQVLPNMTVIVPCDYEQARQATLAIANHNGPCYLRLGRTNVLDVYDKKDKFKIGKIDILKQGDEVVIIACGIMVQEALKAAKMLKEQEIKAMVINCATIKPLDKEGILKAIGNINRVVVCEEHQSIGGLGASIAQLLAQEKPCEMAFVGMQDCFGESGTAEQLLKKYKLDAYEIINKVKQVMHN